MLSVKWVGLFATAFVGLYVIEDLWEKFGDLSMPVVSRNAAMTDISVPTSITGSPEVSHSSSCQP